MRNSVVKRVSASQIVELAAIAAGLVSGWIVFSTMPGVVKIGVLGLIVPFLAEFSVTMARRYQPEMGSMETFQRLLPMSTCDGCGASLGWRAVPFLQVLFGRGRCVCRRMKIDRSYSWYAVGTAMLFCLVVGMCGAGRGLGAAEIAAQLFVVGLPMAVMDFEHQEVDEAMVAVSIGLALVVGGLSGSALSAAVFCVMMVFAGLLASAIRGEIALGFMDVVVAAMFGWFLTTEQVLYALGASAVALGVFVAITAFRAWSRGQDLDLDRPYSFAPAMWIGSLVAVAIV